MGGRGSRSKLPAGSGRERVKFENDALGWDGKEIDLSDSPLAYGDKDPNLSDEARKAIEAFENKRVKAKIEFGLGTDANGVPVEKELRGGSGSVKPTWKIYFDAEVFSHNHPRSKEPGTLGGTFSTGDLSCFTSWQKIKTMRATAAEGTYSISKKDNFDARGFRAYYKQAEQACSDRFHKTTADLLHQYTYTDMTGKEYREACTRAFNKYLVETHNALRDGAKTYGYDYTLERRS